MPTDSELYRMKLRSATQKKPIALKHSTNDLKIQRFQKLNNIKIAKLEQKLLQSNHLHDKQIEQCKQDIKFLQEQLSQTQQTVIKEKNLRRLLELNTGQITTRQSILVTPKNEVEKVKLEKISQYLKEYEDCFLLPETSLISLKDGIRNSIRSLLISILESNYSFITIFSEDEDEDTIIKEFEEEFDRYMLDDNENEFTMFINSILTNRLVITTQQIHQKLSNYGFSFVNVFKEYMNNHANIDLEEKEKIKFWIFGLLYIYKYFDPFVLFQNLMNQVEDQEINQSNAMYKIINFLSDIRFSYLEMTKHLTTKLPKNSTHTRKKIHVAKLQNIYCLNPALTNCKPINIVNNYFHKGLDKVLVLYSYQELCNFAMGKISLDNFQL